MEGAAGGWRAWAGSWGSFERELIVFFLRRPPPLSPTPVATPDGALSPEGMVDVATAEHGCVALDDGATNGPDGDLNDAAVRGGDPADWPVVSGVSRAGARDVFCPLAHRMHVAGEGTPAAIAEPWATQGTTWVGSCPDGASQGADVDDCGADGTDGGQEDAANIGTSN